MTSNGPRFWSNAAYVGARPRLSVLCPFYRSDPRALIADLAEAGGLDGRVELVLADDASGNEGLLGDVRGAIEGLTAPALLTALEENVGRSRIRNRLARTARGAHVLFVDGDMRLERPDFLLRWLAIADEDAEAAFGGLSRDPQPPADPALRLHHAVQSASETLPASVRAKDPGRRLYASNLLVRRQLICAVPFDEAFQGWGWEDVEWGLRIAKTTAIRHVDNPARHGGLDDEAGLLAKYEGSVANFRRLQAAHPRAVGAFPLVRIARLMGMVKIGPATGGGLRRAAASRRLPTGLRVLAAKLYRACLYAPVVRDRPKGRRGELLEDRTLSRLGPPPSPIGGSKGPAL